MAYLTARKSVETDRNRAAMISRGIIGRCSLCCAQPQLRVTGLAPVMTGTISNSSDNGMFRE